MYVLLYLMSQDQPALLTSDSPDSPPIAIAATDGAAIQLSLRFSTSLVRTRVVHQNVDCPGGGLGTGTSGDVW